MSGPERSWHSFRRLPSLAQAVLWILFLPFMFMFWLLKTATSKSAPAIGRLAAGAVLVAMILGIVSS